MVPKPIALGLTLCDRVIVEEGTRHASLVGTFNHIRAPAFPHVSTPFSVYATLTGSDGDATVQLTVTSLETEEQVYAFRGSVHFPDRFSEIRVTLHVKRMQFREPGVYLFTLLVDGEWIAHRRLKVYSEEADS
jgi:hypothetical protein